MSALAVQEQCWRLPAVVTDSCAQGAHSWPYHGECCSLGSSLAQDGPTSQDISAPPKLGC